FEDNTSDMRGRQRRQAALTWIICALLGGGAGFLLLQGDWHVAVPFGIASTSTALSTLLPIRKHSGTISPPRRRTTLVHDAHPAPTGSCCPSSRCPCCCPPAAPGRRH